MRPLGIEVRAGLHTGECEMREDDVAGMAVNIGARIGALAGPGEVLVSSTVKDLVVGSGIEFEPRGAHELKGVPGEWNVFAATSRGRERASALRDDGRSVQREDPAHRHLERRRGALDRRVERRGRRSGRSRARRRRTGRRR